MLSTGEDATKYNASHSRATSSQYTSNTPSAFLGPYPAIQILLHAPFYKIMGEPARLLDKPAHDALLMASTGDKVPADTPRIQL